MKKIALFFLIAYLFPFGAVGQNFKITHGPYLQALGETGLNILWTTNKTGISWVELAPEDGTHFYSAERKKYFGSTNGLKNESTLHNVRIEGLHPATKYRYRIYTQEVLSHEGHKIRYGGIAAGDAYRAKLPVFTTSNKGAAQLSFAIVNDIHQNNEALKTLLSQVDWKTNDLVFFNGDMQNDSRNQEQIFSSFMDTASHIFAARVPMYYARGNHETRGQFASYFPDYFPTESGKLYYLLRWGPVCFVVLDTGEDKPDSDIEYSNIADFDKYRSQQAAWLKEAVKSSDYTSAPYKVVISHMPLFKGWHGQSDATEKFVPILNQAGAQLVLSGHLHRHVKQEANGEHGFLTLVNSNTSIIKAKADGNQLLVEIFDPNGKKIDTVTIKPSSKK